MSAVVQQEFFCTPLLKVKDVCSLLSVSKSTLYRLIDMGDFPKPSKLGKSPRWQSAQVEEFFDSLFSKQQSVENA